MKELLYLLRLDEQALKCYLYNILIKKNMNPECEDGYLYGEGDIPVLLVAHMDTVFETKPKNIVYQAKTDKLFNPSGGLGGDDRCGIYAILSLLEKYTPHVLFTEDEEIGCVGASKAIQKMITPNVKYIIEFDRRGKNDCVFYDCNNLDFIDYIESFGFNLNYGTYSDISILGSAWDIAAANLSVGYYNEHTENEYVIYNELLETINKAENMLKEITKAPYFDYQKNKIEEVNLDFNMYHPMNLFNMLIMASYYNEHKEEMPKRLIKKIEDRENDKNDL